MKHLKFFNTNIEYEQDKSSLSDDIPYVALIDRNGTIKLTEKEIDVNDLPGPYVEIGGIKWASCNLGAEKACDYGDYYMWGSTTPNTYDNCSWATDPFNNGNKSYNSSYFTKNKDKFCPNGILAPEYDAIYKATDGVERMPKQSEFAILIAATNHDICTCTAIGHTGHTPVNGMLFTSIKDNSKKLFIPFSGVRDGSANNGQNVNVRLWSSNLYTSQNSAYYLYCDNGGSIIYDKNGYRYYGRSLRGVKNE